jgi:hypothetical protein
MNHPANQLAIAVQTLASIVVVPDLEHILVEEFNEYPDEHVYLTLAGTEVTVTHVLLEEFKVEPAVQE